jgi:hypothetical protein
MRIRSGTEHIMIELTDAQAQMLASDPSDPPRVVNPRTRETFVLLRVEDYEKIAIGEEMDGWSREDLDAWNAELGERGEWAEYEEEEPS